MLVENRNAALRWIAIGLVAAGAVFLLPFAGSVILAVWLGTFARVLHEPLSRVLHGRRRIAGVLTIVLLTAVIIPIVFVLVSLALDAIELIKQLAESGRVGGLLSQLVSTPGNEPPRIVDVLLGHFERAWGIVSKIAGATVHLAIGIFIVIAGAYGVLVEGRGWYAWAEDHAPVSRVTFRRLAAAFLETGRGLFVGILGTGLLQAILATIAYIVLDVPQALALGLLTLVFSLVPAVGTALVWGPVAAGLALTGRTAAAIGLALFGLLVVSTVDNLVRPYLARRGQLQLPTYLVLIAMFGGVELIGAAGLLIAPLVMRLAKEAVEIYAPRQGRRGTSVASVPLGRHRV